MPDKGNEWKVSVITPVHNTPVEYLKRAYLSMKNQTFGFSGIQWVILFHNCTEEYIRKAGPLFSGYPNIFCKEENSPGTGVGYARNRCLEMAEGKYIFFLDSDDEFLPETVAEVYLEMETHAADVGVFVSANYIGNTVVSEQQVDADPAKGTYVIRSDQNGKEQSVCLSSLCLWNRCFKLELIRNKQISFREDVPIGEDSLFALDATAGADCIILLPQINGYRHYVGTGMSVKPETTKQAMAYFHPGKENVGMGEFLASYYLYFYEEGKKRGLSLDGMLWYQLKILVWHIAEGKIRAEEKKKVDEILQPLIRQLKEPVMLNPKMQEDALRLCRFLRSFFGCREG